MNINIDKMITPQTVHVVPGEGMPKKSNTAQRGDMHIKFNITFPLNFKAEYKNAIVDILKKSQWVISMFILLWNDFSETLIFI